MTGDPADMSRRLTEAIGRVIAQTLNAREAGFYVNSIMNNASREIILGNYGKYIYIILHAHFILQSPCFNNYAVQVPFEGRGGGQLSKRHVNKMVDNVTFVCSMIS